MKKNIFIMILTIACIASIVYSCILTDTINKKYNELDDRITNIMKQDIQKQAPINPTESNPYVAYRTTPLYKEYKTAGVLGIGAITSNLDNYAAVCALEDILNIDIVKLTKMDESKTLNLEMVYLRYNDMITMIPEQIEQRVSNRKDESIESLVKDYGLLACPVLQNIVNNISKNDVYENGDITIKVNENVKKEIIEYIDLCGLTDDEMKVLYNYMY